MKRAGIAMRPLVVSILSLVYAARGASQTPSQTALSITAALVAEELQVRPVALHQLDLLRAADTARVATLRTGLDGKVKQAVAPGNYRLRSVTPVQLLGKSYRWDLVVTVLKGKSTDVELTNVNAIGAQRNDENNRKTPESCQSWSTESARTPSFVFGNCHTKFDTSVCRRSMLSGA